MITDSHFTAFFSLVIPSSLSYTARYIFYTNNKVNEPFYIESIFLAHLYAYFMSQSTLHSLQIMLFFCEICFNSCYGQKRVKTFFNDRQLLIFSYHFKSNHF